MKRLLTVTTLLILTLSLLTSCGASSDASKASSEDKEVPETAQLYLDINFESNVLLNKFDVYVEVNGERLGELTHGEYYTHLVEVPTGDCTVEFINSSKDSVKAAKTFKIEEDSTYRCILHTDAEEIVIYDDELIEGIEGSSLEVPDVVGSNLEKALDELETIGFINVVSQANDDSSIVVSSNWAVVKQSVTPGSSIDKNQQIVLTCAEESYLFNEEFKGLNLADARKKAEEDKFTDIDLREDAAYTNVTELLEDISDEDAAKWLVTDAGRSDDTGVRLYLSYTESISVPDVVGMTVKEAKEALLKQYIFKIETADEGGFWVLDDETYKVVKQSIEAGKNIRYSDEIDLTCKEAEQK